MASSSKRTLRKDCEVFLIGNYSPQIIGNKLPSKREVLKVLFFNLREVKLTLQDGARLAIRETLLFWEKARIPTQSEKNCIPKLKKLHVEWRDFQKYAKMSREKKSAKQLEKEDKFVDELDDLFDIAGENALTSMTNLDDIEFLRRQREKGRPGYMYGIDKQLAEQETRSFERAEKTKNYKKRKYDELDELRQKIELMSTSESEEDVSDNGQDVQPAACVVTQKKMRGRQQIITERLVSALDKCKVSDREAIHIISAVADALGHDLNESVLNRASLQRSRRELREKKVEKIKNEFKNIDLNAAVVHWDGKLLPALTSHEFVDRLPIIISNGDVEQILHVPALESGTGKAQATAIFHVLCDWGLEETVKACCFDTTATNTGEQNGACVLLEGLLERKLLYLPCRHHIFEIILKAVFELKIPGTSGPNVALFKRFYDAWPQIDKSKFLSGVEDGEVCEIFNGEKSSLIDYLKILTNFARGDYKEFAELCILFLGGVSKENVQFHYPGAMHHARWMSKAIYSLKIYLFRNQFKMNASTKKALRDVCIFIVKIYAKNWFLSSLSTKAPQSDLNLLKNLYKYRNIDEAVSKITLTKLLNHLWYLSPEAVAFSFFDDDVSFEIKEKMRQKIKEPECSEDFNDESDKEMHVIKKIIYQRSDLEEVGELGEFTSPKTKIFFTRFNIETSFLEKSPSEWDADEGYRRAKTIVEKIRVTNDTAERGVRLMEEYNDKLSSNDEQKQFIVKVVSDYRKKYPDSKKSTLCTGTSSDK